MCYINVIISQMLTCKAIVTGKRKGETCRFPPSENAYCGRHQRNFQYEKLVSEAKIPCSKFFRGCNNLVDKAGKCAGCKIKYMPKSKVADCKHEGCTFKTKGDKYCKKHSRDLYFDEEKEKGIKYCDPARGCFTVCEEGFSKCQECRDKYNIREKNTRAERNTIHNALDKIDTDKQICVNCGKDYTKFLTSHKKPSKLCVQCNQTNVNQDAKRTDRLRNYKEENFNNQDSYFRDYVVRAAKRGLSMGLQAADFKELIISPCYYCGHHTANEINGVDRVNNDIGYEKPNCVSCCETCNMMKHYFHPVFFIQLCKIFTGTQPSPDFYTTWKEYYGRTNNKNYKNYKKVLESKRQMTMSLTQEEWDKLTRQPCYLCGYRHAKGIGLDRINNSKREYTIDNVKACCGTCNDIKNAFSLETIKNQAALIVAKWPTTDLFDNIPRTKNPMRESTRKNPEIIKERTHWKSLGIYYDILSDTNDYFTETSISEEHYELIKRAVETESRAEAIALIQTYLT